MTIDLGTMVWRQFGAAIDALKAAIEKCPEALWCDQSREPQVWYLAYHTLFWLDYYLTESRDDFKPPEPFTMSEMDPAGILPDRIYTKAELLAYLDHGRKKCKAIMAVLTEDRAAHRYNFGWMDFSMLELHLYNMRHVQHGAAQMNLILRQEIDDAPRWARYAED